MALSTTTAREKYLVCELCNNRSPTVKDYSDDFELQTALTDYFQKISGEAKNILNVDYLCDGCYDKVILYENEAEELRE